MRAIAACFSFLAGLGRIFGIATPHSHSAGAVVRQVSEKLVSLDEAAARLAQPEGVFVSDCLFKRLARGRQHNESRVSVYRQYVKRGPRERQNPRSLYEPFPERAEIA